jgi:hypothetical protein
MDRRALVTASVGAGLAALAAAPAAAEPQSSEGGFPPSAVRALETIREAVERIAATTASCQAFVCPATEQIRQTQKQFFKANGRMPTFIDVGFDIFLGAYDWHIRTRQEPQLTRLADGRQTLRFITTTLILRNDVSDGFLSVGYEER